MEETKVKKKGLKKERLNAFLRNSTISVLIILFLLIVFNDRVFIKIKSGERGVLFDLVRGTRNELYGEGLKIISPLNEMFIYSLRTQTIVLEQTVLSHNGLKINIKYNVLFKPILKKLHSLHQHVGPKYAETIVIPSSQSWTRKFIADLTPEDIFLIDKGVVETNAIKQLRKEMFNHDISLENYFIETISLPDTVSKAIELKFKEQEISLLYDFKIDVERKEKIRKVIEAEGIKQFQTISNVSPLQWRALDVTEKLAKSPNSKIIMMGNSSKELPILLNNDDKK